MFQISSLFFYTIKMVEEIKSQTIPDKISTKLRSALPSLVDLHIEDKSGGCGQSYLVIVVADADFRDIKLLERQ
jgi:stress-induced morphogen